MDIQLCCTVVSVEQPLYVRVYAKEALMHTLEADTAFLAAQDVMDYSLLVGAENGDRAETAGTPTANASNTNPNTNANTNVNTNSNSNTNTCVTNVGATSGSAGSSKSADTPKQQTPALMCGIIDYMRTYTWDKKLETKVKTWTSEQGKGPMKCFVGILAVIMDLAIIPHSVPTY